MISLVLATYGRGEEARIFLNSLAKQDFKDYELIVVDQNQDNRFKKVFDDYKNDLHNVSYIHTELPGVARARNIGLRQVKGEVIAFPDDDCQYPPELLLSVHTILAERPELDGVSGVVKDFSGKIFRGYEKDSGWLEFKNTWYRSICVSFFLRRPLVDKIGFFDEEMGIGAKWGAGEETDFLLRGVNAGAKIYFDSSIAIFHQEPLQYDPQKLITRGYTYGLGMGRLLKKHRFPWYITFKWMIKPLFGIMLRLLQGNIVHAKYYWNVFRGRVYAWVKS